MTVFERILRNSLSTDPMSVNNVDELNSELESTYYSLPEILRPRSVSDALVDSSTLVVTRLCVLFVYEKCRCVLHRGSAVLGNSTSVQLSYDASSHLVAYFLDIFPDLQPGGQFESERWFDSTLTWHDFLLGITMLCTVLCVTSQDASKVKIDYAGSMDLLRRSQDVCAQVSRRSKHTGRVQRLINATILRFSSATIENQGMMNGNLQDPNAAVFNSNGIMQPDWTIDSSLSQSLGDEWMSWEVTMPPAIEDESWAYLEQFLNLPSDPTLDV